MIVLTYAQACLLGMLQGLTEFLPVSSTAHMAILPQAVFHMDDPGAAFSAVVQLGPIVAIIAFFREDLARYARGIVRHPRFWRLATADLDAKLGWFVLLGTLPLAVFGVLLERKIDTTFRGLYVIAASLILLAAVLWFAERSATRTRSLQQMTLGRSQAVGWAQVLALVPGASRSGVTIAAGLFQGLDRESAARFSFLLSIPAITAAGVYKLFKVLRATHLGSQADLPSRSSCRRSRRVCGGPLVPAIHEGPQHGSVYRLSHRAGSGFAGPPAARLREGRDSLHSGAVGKRFRLRSKRRDEHL